MVCEVSDLISRDALKETWCANCDNKHLCGDKARCDEVKELYDMPTIEAEPTFEQIEEYCRKRCLVVVDGALFNEMKSRWSAEPIKHGRWELVEDDIVGLIAKCSVCGEKTYNAVSWDFKGNEHRYPYCPKCGARCDL